MAWLEQSYKDLINLARARLPATAPNTGPLHSLMPQLERTHLLYTEADVLRASSLYLFHPVHVAISQLLNTGTLDCRGELSATGGCRTDIRWVYRNGNQMINIAILEVKNTKVIHWDDFASAMANHNSAKMKRDLAYSRKNNTHFRQNAYWLSKQARKYSENVKVPDVAIFDWNAMFIFDFNGMNENAQNPVLASGIWFTESNSSAGQGETFRTILLGFLIRTLRRHHLVM